MTNSHVVFRNLIFDLDGTLTDPRESFANCIGFALSRLGKDIPPSEQLYQYIGPPIHGAFTSLLETTDADLIEQAVCLYRQRLGAEGICENVAYSGVIDALIDLRAAGCQLFVATAKPLKFAIPIMEHCGLHSYFSDFYGSELGRPNTPKAELIASVLKDWRLPASETAMIGDRHHDIEGAAANGVYSVGVTYGYGSPEELTEAGADALCSHPTELTNHFL